MFPLARVKSHSEIDIRFSTFIFFFSPLRVNQPSILSEDLSCEKFCKVTLPLESLQCRHSLII